MKIIILAILLFPVISFSQIENYNSWSKRTERTMYLVNQQGYDAVRLTVQIDSLISNPGLVNQLEQAGFDHLVFTFEPTVSQNTVEFGVLINELSLYDFKVYLQTEFPGILFVSEAPYNF